MRSQAIAAVIAATVLTTATASAEASESPPVSPAPPAADQPTGTPPARGPISAGPGFVGSLGMGFVGLGGSLLSDVGVGAALASMDLRLGGYVTPHIGLMAGVQGGYGGLSAGCAGTCSNALHVQLPVVVQYAFIDRVRGVYVEAGVGILSTLWASTGVDDDGPVETLKASTPFDYKLGAGYRFALAAPPGKVATKALDLRLNVDLGQYRSIDYRTAVGEISGDIADGMRAMHVAVGLNLAYQF